MTDVLNGLWAAMNSPAVIAALAAGLVLLLNRLYAAKPTWAKYEGTIISAVKYAEKAIPDDTDNTALARLNSALQYATAILEATENRLAKPAEVASLKEGIQIMHAELESQGGLDTKAPSETVT